MKAPVGQSPITVNDHAVRAIGGGLHRFEVQTGAPSSLNDCMDEWRAMTGQERGRCEFRPADDAIYSAEYHGESGEWQVEARDRATEMRRWQVDDRSDEISSGYCVFK